MTIGRREFMEASGAAVGALTIGELDSIRGIDEHEETNEEERWDIETDYAVAGASLGGCISALVAAENGLNVVLLEKGPETGGTALSSAGGLYIIGDGPYDLDHMQDIAPDVDDDLGEALADNFTDTIEYLEERDFPVEPLPWRDPDFDVSIGASYEERREFFDHFENEFEGHEGEIHTDTPAKSLVLDDDGTPVGILGQDRETGELLSVGASDILLAVGGFQAEPGMKVQYLGRDADNVAHRSAPTVTGDGLQMALAAGGRHSRSMGRFFGHPAPWPPLPPQYDIDEHYDEDLNLVWAQHSLGFFTSDTVMLNRHGNRFVDESRGSDIINQEISEQPQGYAFSVLDSELAEDIDDIETIEEQGGNVWEADSLEELVEEVDDLADRAVHTIEQFNTAIEEDDDTQLTIPRESERHTVTEPPFTAVQFTAGVAQTHGGVDIDTNGRVLDRSGSPIPNLYAIPGTAGGVTRFTYVGSLCQLAVFGRLAAEDVVDAA